MTAVSRHPRSHPVRLRINGTDHALRVEPWVSGRRVRSTPMTSDKVMAKDALEDAPDATATLSA